MAPEFPEPPNAFFYEALEDLTTNIILKGYRVHEGELGFVIEDGGRKVRVTITYDPGGSDIYTNRRYLVASGSTPAQAIASAAARINDLESVSETKRRAFLSKLSNLIESASDAGVDPESTRPFIIFLDEFRNALPAPKEPSS